MYITSVNKTNEEIVDLEGVIDTTVRWLLSREIGVPNFEMRYFEIKKGGHTEYHTHPWEHEVFIISGEGVVKGPDTEKIVKPGDAIYVPGGERHQFLNDKTEPFCFICMIPKRA